jgi:hypothetical protein
MPRPARPRRRPVASRRRRSRRARLALARGELVAGGPFEGFGSTLDGAGPLLAGAQGEPGSVSCGAGAGWPRARAGRARARRRPATSSGGCQTPRRVAPRVPRARPVAVEVLARHGDRPLGAFGLADGRATARPGSRAARRRRHPGVGLVQPPPARHRRSVATATRGLPGRDECEPGLLDGRSRHRAVEPGSRRRPPGARAGWEPRALPPTDEPGAEDVAVGRDRRDPLTASDQRQGVRASARGPPVRAAARPQVGRQRGQSTTSRPTGADPSSAATARHPTGRAVVPTSSAAARPLVARNDSRAPAACSRRDDREGLGGPPEAAATAPRAPADLQATPTTVPMTACSVVRGSASRVAAPSGGAGTAPGPRCPGGRRGAVTLGVALAAPRGPRSARPRSRRVRSGLSYAASSPSSPSSSTATPASSGRTPARPRPHGRDLPPRVASNRPISASPASIRLRLRRHLPGEFGQPFAAVGGGAGESGDTRSCSAAYRPPRCRCGR